MKKKIKIKKNCCKHCNQKTKNKNPTVCINCKKIPKCKMCGITMGYWNDDNTLLIYNDRNKPSLLNPDICMDCEKFKN